MLSLNPKPRKLDLSIDPAVRRLPAQDWLKYQQAESVVQIAQQQADDIVQAAQAAFEAEKQRGYAAGVMEAKKDQAQKMIEVVMAASKHLAGLEKEIASLVLKSVQKIIADFEDEAKVLVVVHQALSNVRCEGQILLRVHPDHEAALKKHMNALLLRYSGVGSLEVVADVQMAPFSCLLESDLGYVECDLEDQLKAIEKAFAQVF